MSVYTTELRYIIERINDKNVVSGYNGINELIENAIDSIFEKYPIFDESYRNVLNTKILKHYFFYEIGTETKGQFLFYLNEKMNLIMPYYNKLYLAWLHEFNPLYNVDTTTEHSGKSNDNEYTESHEKATAANDTTAKETNTLSSTKELNETTDSRNENSSTENSKDKNTRRFSDTPQGSLQNIENNTYLSEAEINDSTGLNNLETLSTDNSSRKNNESSNQDSLKNNKTTQTNVNNVNKNDNRNLINTNEYIDHVFGFSNNPAENLLKYQEALLNIDNMIIEELNDCFMQVF